MQRLKAGLQGTLFAEHLAVAEEDARYERSQVTAECDDPGDDSVLKLSSEALAGTRKQIDAIVVGAGHNGLACAAYLARAGNCAACHTERGGAPYAGGRGIATPFGTVYASNLTPDPATGLGRWSADHFWRALHHGRSADGRLLYPAFPYPDMSRVTREDSDAIYFYLRTLPPVRQASPTTDHGCPDKATQPRLCSKS